MRKLIIPTVLLSAAALAACGHNTEQRAATGAGTGVIAGAVVAGPVGALVGAAAGGAGGTAVSHAQEGR
jgi:predicted small secreted protein